MISGVCFGSPLFLFVSRNGMRKEEEAEGFLYVQRNGD